MLARIWFRHGLILGLGWLALAAVFAPTFANMVGVWWHSSTFNHCFLIPVIAGYLAWHKQPQLAACAPSIAGAGVLYILANGFLWVLGSLAALAALTHLAIVGMLIGMAWTVLGTAVCRVLIYPLCYLYFAVPEGEFLVPYLQDWTAHVAVALLRLSGIPVFVEGRYLTIPTGAFVVAEACSGINYLIATLAVGAMFMYLHFNSWRRRLIFLLFAILVPLLANAVRAYGIVMIAHLSEYRYALGIDHFIYGWVFFGLVIAILFWVGSLFSDVDEGAGVPPPVRSGPVVPGRRVWTMLALALSVAMAPRLLLSALDSTRPMAAPIALPQMAGWRGPELIDADLGSKFPGADQHLTGRYTRADGRTVTVDVIYYGHPGGTGELANQTNAVFDVKTWKQLSYDRHELVAAAQLGAANEVLVRDLAGDESLLWYWYDAQGEKSARSLTVKLAEMRARVAGRNDGGALLVFRSKYDDSGAAASALNALIATGAFALERMHAQGENGGTTR